jgi:regulator of cell morphogenesis and NO signaling
VARAAGDLPFALMMVEPPKVVDVVNTAPESSEAPPSWESPAALVAHIVEHHHTYARAAIGNLSVLSKEVARGDAEKHPEVVRVTQLFDLLRAELEPHMRAEEGSLFPAILQMARPACNVRHREALRLSIVVLEHDHHALGDVLEQLKEATNDFVPPEDASATLRAFYTDLAAFHANLLEHMHLEDDVLLPRACAPP